MAEEQQQQQNGSSAAASMECVDRLNRASTSVSAWLNSELSHASASASGTSDGESSLELAVQPLRQISLSLAAVRDQSRIEMEQIITSLVATIPSLGVELSLMSENAKALDHRIRSLQHANAPNTAVNGNQTDEDDARQALTQIAILSRTKAQMIAARHTLREAQSWTTLEAEFAAMTGENRLEEAVQRLVNARTSLHAFQEAASPATSSAALPNSSFSMQERSELLLKLSADLETKLVPALQQALADRDSASTIKLAALFVQLESVDQTFLPTYLRTRSGDVLLKWSRRTSAAPATRSQLAAQLTGLLSDAMALLGEERIFAAKIFSEPKQAAQLLLSHVLSHLEPSLDLCIAQAAQTADTDTELFLADLTETWKIVNDSFRSFAEILAPDARQQDTTTRPISLSPATAESDWRKKLLEPFLPYHTQFAQLEAQAMQFRLGQSAQNAASISTRAAQAIAVAKGSMRRSAEFTNSVSLAALLPHLEQLLASVLDQCHRSEEEESRKLLRDVEDRIQRSYANSHLGRGGTSAGSGMVDERAESLTLAEWDQFRTRTNKLAECRAAFEALNDLEIAVARQLSQVSVPQPSSERDFTSPTRSVATSSLNSSHLHDSIAAAKRRLLLLQNQPPDALTSAASQETLLPTLRNALATLTRTLHETQHALVLTPFTHTDLQTYPQLPIWRSNKRPGLPANEYDLAMPKFSLSPTNQMARIGEAMLNLPRLFEGLADEALLFGLQLHHLQKRSRATAAASVRSDTHARHRKAFSMAEAPDASLQRGAEQPGNGQENDGDDDSADEDEDAADPTARILTRYLRSLLRAFFAQFLGTTLPQLSGGVSGEQHARPLSEIGTSQLAADLEYLSNITSVLWSPSERVLAPYRQCVEMPDATGKRLLEHRRLGTQPGDADAQYTQLVQRDSAALDVIARLRGWNTS